MILDILSMNLQEPFPFDLNRDQTESCNVSAHFPEKENAMWLER